MNTVDVAIPCYNYGRFLEECVRSVLTQNEVSVRVLILDDHSSDNSAEVAAELAQDSRVSFVSHKRNRGHILTYNEGIEWASADYFLLLSADDYLLPGALRRAAELLTANENMAFCYGRAIRLESTGNTTLVGKMPSRTSAMFGPYWIAACCATNYVPTPTAVVRTWLQKHVGGYSPDLPHAGDMEMWFRLAAYGSVGFIETPQAVYRRHATNMSCDYSVTELEERKKAIDYFFRYSGRTIYGAERLHKRAIRSLRESRFSRLVHWFTVP